MVSGDESLRELACGPGQSLTVIMTMRYGTYAQAADGHPLCILKPEHRSYIVGRWGQRAPAAPVPIDQVVVGRALRLLRQTRSNELIGVPPLLTVAITGSNSPWLIAVISLMQLGHTSGAVTAYGFAVGICLAVEGDCLAVEGDRK